MAFNVPFAAGYRREDFRDALTGKRLRDVLNDPSIMWYSSKPKPLPEKELDYLCDALALFTTVKRINALSRGLSRAEEIFDVLFFTMDTIERQIGVYERDKELPQDYFKDKDFPIPMDPDRPCIWTIWNALRLYRSAFGIMLTRLG